MKTLKVLIEYDYETKLSLQMIANDAGLSEELAKRVVEILAEKSNEE
jgi:hypothetical protein